jgi:hypothetical protein
VLALDLGPDGGDGQPLATGPHERGTATVTWNYAAAGNGSVGSAGQGPAPHELAACKQTRDAASASMTGATWVAVHASAGQQRDTRFPDWLAATH